MLAALTELRNNMRIRILKQLTSSIGYLKPGDVREVPDELARSWCKAGLAMEDKSEDGSNETKMKRTRDTK
jgi:hypothetical protein